MGDIHSGQAADTLSSADADLEAPPWVRGGREPLALGSDGPDPSG